jgi:hypothetical protein
MILVQGCKEKGSGDERAWRLTTLDTNNLARVELPETLFDFGELRQGEIVGHTFIVKNAGEKTLRLFDVETSCGCTGARFTRKPIKPGETGSVEIIFDSSHLQGKQYKVAHVYSNVRNGIFELSVKASVKATYQYH